MSYWIRQRKLADSTVFYWQVLYNKTEGGKRTSHHVPKSQLVQHGFLPSMSVEEAKARCRQLNALGKLERQKQRALAGLKQRELIECAHLPEHHVQEFLVYLQRRTDIGVNGPQKWKKAQSHWNYVQKLVAHLNMPPSEWEEESRAIYSYLTKRQTSRFYASKVLSVLNLWGAFLARRTGQSYIPVPFPKGHDREMLVDSYEDSAKKKKTSAPITPAMLNAARGKLPEAQWSWLALSVWFGLRPKEVDGLGKPGRYRVERDEETGADVLWVYQTKLTGVAREQRWKPIPCVYPEQQEALAHIGKQKRPLVKTIQALMGHECNTYGGRKGFVDLLMDLGQEYEQVVIWMGHRAHGPSGGSITWTHYKDKQRVKFKPIK